jgi:ER lumen protein retaining receptor
LLSFKVVPCAALALLIHPSTSHNIVNRICWAFCVYLEAVSVLPQLRLMQNTKVNQFTHFPFPLDCRIKHAEFIFASAQIVEPFTAHYVFALGVARFLSCAHWVLQVCLSK